jgi:hypothetical protein
MILKKCPENHFFNNKAWNQETLHTFKLLILIVMLLHKLMNQNIVLKLMVNEFFLGQIVRKYSNSILSENNFWSYFTYFVVEL